MAHAALSSLFPSICISFDEIDYKTGVIVNAIDKPLPISREDFLERWNHWYAEHPGVIYRKSGGVRTVVQISDFLSEREFSETAFYNEFWQFLGIRHQLSAIIPLPDRIVAVSANRDSAFTERESKLMELLQPHFAQAYQILRSIDPEAHGASDVEGSESRKQVPAWGDLEVVDGLWKGSTITGKLWRS